jgi:hypothetical protein
MVWLGPWLGMYFLYMVLVRQNHVALMLLAFLFLETFLPTGTVRTLQSKHSPACVMLVDSVSEA